MKAYECRQSGPEFLESVADAELSNGNEQNAAIYRERAQEWRQLERQLEAAEAQPRTPAPKARQASGRGAITPTDTRS